MKQSNPSIDAFELSEQAQSINEQLEALIGDTIEKSETSAIPFSQFMNIALYQPTLGYYQNNLQTFGESGDFITAPEMGSYFAQCIANSLKPLFQAEGELADKSILEIGAGSGSLVLNLMSSLDQMNALPTTYFILEPSATLQQQQREQVESHIPELAERVEWINKMPSLFEGIILANEVIDAIPFERIQRVDQQWYGLGVSVQEQRLVSKSTQVLQDKDIPEPLLRGAEYVDGYTTEYRPLAEGWIKSLAASLNSGAIVLIDYGYSADEYYHPQRVQGTLSCFVRHHKHDDPFQYIGIQDITAHVDFTQVARAATDSGLIVEGYTTQAGFLLENGITELAEAHNQKSSAEIRYQQSRELQQLLMPGQMGEVIKVILLTKSLKDSIKGFSLQDHLHRL